MSGSAYNSVDVSDVFHTRSRDHDHMGLMGFANLRFLEEYSVYKYMLVCL